MNLHEIDFSKINLNKLTYNQKLELLYLLELRHEMINGGKYE